MPSPDLTPYADLTLYDRSPVEIYEDGILHARESLPEWDPQPATIEAAILQAAALYTGELAGAINRVPSSVLEGLLKLFGVSREIGERATGTVTVTAVDDLGYTLVDGTRLGYMESVTGGDPILWTFDVVGDHTITSGETTVDVEVIGTTWEQYPLLGAGTALRLLTPVHWVDSLTVADTIAVGSDPETDAEYLERAVGLLRSYSSALVLPHQFDSYVLQTYHEIYRVKTYSLVDPANDLLSDPEAPGYVTVYVAGAGGASIDASTMTTIEEDLASRATAGLTITVKNAYIEPLDVSASVVGKASYLGTSVQDAATLTVENLLGPDVWDWGDTIYLNEVIALLDRVAGVDRVNVVEIEGLEQDYEFDRYGTLPLVTATITVL